jgi:hypothetical protein
MSYSQGQDLTFAPLINQSAQGQALPPDTVPPVAPNGLNPYLIPDGLSMNVRLKYLPYRSYPMQIRLLDTYRRQALSGMWQPRWYCSPVDPSVPIAAGDTLNNNLHVAAGSVLYGYTFNVLPSTSGPTALVTDIRVTLTDTNSNAVLISQYEIASAFVANLKTGTPKAGFGFVMPPAPYQLANGGLNGGGDLLVNLVNTVSYPRQCQLVLMFIEPAGSPQ